MKCSLGIVLLAAMSLSALLSAQTNRGGLSGAVRDASGGAVAGAQVTVRNVGTNQTWHLTTSKTGDYALPDLEPAVYALTVAAPGFGSVRFDAVKVDTATTRTVNVALQLKSVKAEVTVSATPPAVDLESGTLGQTISQQEIDSLPLDNRSVLDLALTTPNVSGSVGSEDPGITAGSPVPGFNLNLNGGRSGTSIMLADGVNNTGVGLARSVVSFSPETVQEFTVQTSAYSAAYGSTGGGVINITTKSGTNDLHGEALWLSRNPALGASPFTTAAVNRPKPTLRDNQFSLTVGGPVVIPHVYDGHNKSFFFAAVEPRYRRDHLQEDTLLPTAAMRQGNFSGVVPVPGGWVPSSVAAQFGIAPTGDGTIYQQFNQVGNQLQIQPAPAAGKSYPAFAGNAIPSAMLDPVAQKLLQYMPQPQAYYLNGGGRLANYTLSRFLKEDYTRYTLRLDHNFSPANQFSARLTAVPAIGQTGFGSAVNGNGGSYSNSRQIVLSETHLFSPTVANDVRVNYTRGIFSSTFSPAWDIKTGRNLSTLLGLPSLTHGGLPLFQFDTVNAFANIGSQGSTLNDNVEERYSGGDILYVNRGSMNWSFGVDFDHALLNELSFYSAAGGNYFFRYLQTNSNNTGAGTGGNAFASFLLGVPNNVTLANALLPYYYRWNDGDAFAQDDWKVTPHLTLNLGLRYSLQIPRIEKYNHQGVFLPGSGLSYPIAKPVTLSNGQPYTSLGLPALTSALVPAFAFDNLGGRGRTLWPTRWNDFEPRLGFSWAPQWAGFGNHLVVRGGYGLSHLPLTGQNRLPNPNFGAPTTGYGETAGQTDATYAMRLSSNPPLVTPLTPDQALNIPAGGLSFLPSLNYAASGFVLANNIKTPYAQNWNLTLDYPLGPNSVLEFAYVGNKGTHLFLPRINANPSSLDLINALYGKNLSVTATIPDPLGRKNAVGQVIRIPQGSLGSQFLGFSNLYTVYNSAANSIRHAVYASFVRRATRGLFLSANYTYGKSLDDASDASPDKFSLNTETVGGQVSFGAPLRSDRSVSTFDVRQSLSTSFLYHLPLGRGQRYLGGMPGVLNAVLGNWTVSGIEHLQSGLPFLVTLVDSNLLGDTTQTHTIRPNLVAGVPVVNPLWNAGCPVGNLCEPYLNPAAFERPALGQFGTAPRTIDGARGPLQQFLDLSVQKNFALNERFRLQLRGDFLNALNHPVFAPVPNASGSDLFSQPSQAKLTAAQYNAWAAFNNQPLAGSSAGLAEMNQINGQITSNLNGAGVLPANFFTVALPAGFATSNANAFDIRTVQGLKLYRLRQSFNQGFGGLYTPPIQRTIEFAIKIYF